MESTFDVIVIGSGPGGYIAAIRAAQLGYRTAIVEKYSSLGGTCTNVGCIPAKALLDSTEHFHTASEKFGTHGIRIHGLALDFQQLIKRKSEVVRQNVNGIKYLMNKNKIEVINGLASFTSAKTISVKKTDGTFRLAKMSPVLLYRHQHTHSD
jgi:dihydrolipoamide dehydrogenase